MHLVGIGGAGMSAIATVLVQMGYSIEGSDLKESPNVRRLRGMGAAVGIGHRARNLGRAEVVIRSSAVSPDNPEVIEAERRGIPVITRARMLAEIMKTRESIAIAGTHGKTTTSSIVTQMLIGCGADPAFLIGGELNEIGSNARYGDGRYLVAEADESDGSLLCLRPTHVVLTNVELDHPDYFSSLEHTAGVFREFLDLLPPGGTAVVCGDDPMARKVGLEFRADGGNVFFYGREDGSDYTFSDEAVTADGCSYIAYRDGAALGTVKTRVPGMHNVYNSLAALAIGDRLGFPTDLAIDGIGRFQGVRRRFELVGTHDGIRVIDDYAHHPTEVKAVVDLASSIVDGRVLVVFQPHRYSRTGKLAGEFAQSFDAADVVVVTDIYGAGEEPEPGVTGRLVADGILERDPGKELVYVPSRSELAARVVEILRDGDTVITMGAGDITQCSREILGLLGPEKS